MEKNPFKIHVGDETSRVVLPRIANQIKSAVFHQPMGNARLCGRIWIKNRTEIDQAHPPCLDYRANCFNIGSLVAN